MPTVRTVSFRHSATSAACALTCLVALVLPAAAASSALGPQPASSTRAALNPQPLPPKALAGAGSSAATRIAQPVPNQKSGIIIVGGAPAARPNTSTVSAKPAVRAASAPR